MEIKFFIPLINPIALTEKPVDDGIYRQKYNRTDSTDLHFVADEPYSPVLTVNNEHGEVKEIHTIAHKSTDNGRFYYNFNLNFAALAEGCYKLRLYPTSQKSNDYLESRVIEVAEAHDNTFLLKYTDNASRIVHDVNFREMTVNFAMRVEGGFLPKSLNIESTDNVAGSPEGGFSLLQSSAYEGRTLNVGYVKGVPDSIHSIINRALSCNKVAIDGTDYCKAPGASWESSEEEFYDLRSWSIDMMYTEDRNSLSVNS